jgi:hypothetical protein
MGVHPRQRARALGQQCTTGASTRVLRPFSTVIDGRDSSYEPEPRDQLTTDHGITRCNDSRNDPRNDSRNDPRNDPRRQAPIPASPPGGGGRDRRVGVVTRPTVPETLDIGAGQWLLAVPPAGHGPNPAVGRGLDGLRERATGAAAWLLRDRPPHGLAVVAVAYQLLLLVVALLAAVTFVLTVVSGVHNRAWGACSPGL